MFHFEHSRRDILVECRSCIHDGDKRIDTRVRIGIVRGKSLIERPRARRYPFVASIELVDMASETEVREQTTDLSVFGCQVTAQKPLLAGTKFASALFAPAPSSWPRAGSQRSQKWRGRGVHKDRAKGPGTSGEMASGGARCPRTGPQHALIYAIETLLNLLL
jgi:hypothetical protein